MKVTVIFALLLVVCIAYTQAQRCRPAPGVDCYSRPDLGHGGRGCQPRTMWYRQGRQCREMRYRGCGGNNNRYCSKAECERRCPRSG